MTDNPIRDTAVQSMSQAIIEKIAPGQDPLQTMSNMTLAVALVQGINRRLVDRDETYIDGHLAGMHQMVSILGNLMHKFSELGCEQEKALLNAVLELFLVGAVIAEEMEMRHPDEAQGWRTI